LCFMEYENHNGLVKHEGNDLINTFGPSITLTAGLLQDGAIVVLFT